MINTQELQGQWNTLRGKVKEKWGNLTDDDLQVHGGNFDQLIGRIQEKTGESREAIEHFLTDLTSRGASTISKAVESVGQYVQETGGNLREQFGDVAGRVQQGYEQSRQMVRAHPTQSFAAAMGVGLILGVVVGLAIRSR